jgi:hypothetical protein
MSDTRSSCATTTNNIRMFSACAGLHVHVRVALTVPLTADVVVTVNLLGGSAHGGSSVVVTRSGEVSGDCMNLVQWRAPFSQLSLMLQHLSAVFNNCVQQSNQSTCVNNRIYVHLHSIFLSFDVALNS